MFKVLLVDDEHSVIQLLESLVNWEEMGYTICGTASNGEEALEVLKHSNPHLAIIDIRMPKVNGLQLLQQASEILYLRTKFIVLSAYNDFQYAKTAMRYGVRDYILKPIDDEELIPVLKRVSEQIEDDIGTLEAQANKRKFASSNYINRIINGENSESLYERCKHMLHLNDNDLYRCGLVEINEFDKWMNDLDDVEIQSKRLVVRKTIENVLGSDHMLNIFDNDIHRFGIIVTRDMIKKKYEDLEKLKITILENCQCSVSVALSEEAREIENIGKLYRQALFALQYRSFQNPIGVLYYEQFKNVQLNYNFCESNPEVLLDNIKNSSPSAIEEDINNVFNEFYGKKCAPEVITTYIRNIEFDLVNHIMDHDGSVDEIITKFESLIRTIGKVSIDSLREDFYTLAIYISEFYKSIICRSSKDIIIEIKDFVHQNYQKNLKLQEVAKAYFVNPVYLGQVFAKTVGMHFNEYLHSVRIEEAIKLLKRTDMKISSIASMVGYCDSDYFVNKFKAITRHLPSDYRKKQNDENS